MLTEFGQCVGLEYVRDTSAISHNHQSLAG